MALLKRTKKEKTETIPAKKKEETKAEISKKEAASEAAAAQNYALIPHMTEKAASSGEKGAYVFKIKPLFNKIMVKEAVKKQYGVSPVAVRIINMPAKRVFIRRRAALKPGFKKAVVYLKKGDKINIA